jgi:hypothetical protein
MQVLTVCKGIAKRCIAVPSDPFILRRVPERKETKGFVLSGRAFFGRECRYNFLHSRCTGVRPAKEPDVYLP